jgi:hypothetical protein
MTRDTVMGATFAFRATAVIVEALPSGLRRLLIFGRRYAPGLRRASSAQNENVISLWVVKAPSIGCCSAQIVVTISELARRALMAHVSCKV